MGFVTHPVKNLFKSVVKGIGQLFGSFVKKETGTNYDPAAERAQAERDATASANVLAAAEKKRRRQNSLLASGQNTNADQSSSVLASGKSKFGE